MVKEETAKQKREELKKQYEYCKNLMNSLRPSFDKSKIRLELIALQREIEILTWAIDDELPF